MSIICALHNVIFIGIIHIMCYIYIISSKILLLTPHNMHLFHYKIEASNKKFVCFSRLKLILHNLWLGIFQILCVFTILYQIRQSNIIVIFEDQNVRSQLAKKMLTSMFSLYIYPLSKFIEKRLQIPHKRIRVHQTNLHIISLIRHNNIQYCGIPKSLLWWKKYIRQRNDGSIKMVYWMNQIQI